jgi:uncharacterized membrane protein YbhN (UPF0104 family)
MAAPSGVITPDQNAVPPPPGLNPQGSTPRRAGRKRFFVLKAALTAALFIYLGTKLDASAMGARLQSASVLLLAAATAIVTLEIPLAALRWMLLARRTGAALSYKLALQLSFAGLFFGQVLPASIGGDVVRGWLAHRNGLTLQPLVSSLVLDRITALLAAVVLILTGLPWMLGDTAGTLAVTAGLSALLVVGLLAGLCVDLLPLPQALKARPFVTKLLNLIAQTRGGLASASGLVALSISVAIHVMTIFAVVMLGAGLGLGEILLPSVLVVPTALIAAAIPVSLNGWGVREGVMVAGFALFGMAEADAFLVSVLLGLAVVVSALPGGFTWLTLK